MQKRESPYIRAYTVIYEDLSENKSAKHMLWILFILL